MGTFEFSEVNLNSLSCSYSHWVMWTHCSPIFIYLSFYIQYIYKVIKPTIADLKWLHRTIQNPQII